MKANNAHSHVGGSGLGARSGGVTVDVWWGWGGRGRGVEVVDVWLVVGGGVGRRGVGGFGGSDVAGEVVVRRL